MNCSVRRQQGKGLQQIAVRAHKDWWKELLFIDMGLAGMDEWSELLCRSIRLRVNSSWRGVELYDPAWGNYRVGRRAGELAWWAGTATDFELQRALGVD